MRLLNRVSEPKENYETECVPELEFVLGLCCGIICVMTVLVSICAGYKSANFDQVLGQGLCIIFMACCIIIAILITADAISGIPMSSPFVFGVTGIATTATIIGIIVGLVVTGVSGTTSCKLGLGLDFGQGLGISCLIAFIMAVIFKICLILLT